MTGATKAADLDAALKGMACSQHTLLEQLEPVRGDIHACTDITGFGLLGHLGEMLQTTPELTIQLDGAAIPAYAGALNLFEQGVPARWPPRTGAWRWLEGPVQLRQPSTALLELLVDPQTCGPSCWPAAMTPPQSSLGAARGFRSAAQQQGMGEIGGLRFTAKTRLFNLRMQRFELARHGRRRPTAGQPELLRRIRSCSRCLRSSFPLHGAEGDGIRPIAASIRSLRLNKRSRGL